MEGEPNLIDSQQDVFNFNFNGYSGTFYIDNGVIYINENPDIKASFIKIQNPTTHKYYLKFTFITPDGISYEFGGEEAFVETTKITTNCSKSYSREPNSTWYLKQIKDSKNNNIDFIYDNLYKSYPLNYSESYSITYGNNNLPGEIISQKSEKCTSYFESNNAKYLKNISSKNINVSFNYDNRLDYTTGYKLNSINISKNNTSIPILFNYVYSGPNTSDVNEYKKRLFLNNLSINDSKFSFEYDNINSLSDRLSSNIDLYGYSNSNTYSYLSNFHYNEDASMTKFISVFGDKIANRNVDLYKSKYGVLTKIIYPTKGYTELTYENNTTTELVNKDVFLTNNLYVVKRNCEPYSSQSDTQVFEFISNGQDISFDSSMNVNRCDGVNVNDFHDTYSLTIENLTTSQTILTFNGRYDRFLKTNNGFEMNGENIISPITTTNNSKYRITLSTNSIVNNVSANLTLKYNKTVNQVEENVNYSGARIKSIKDYNGNTLENSKTIYYNNIQNLNNLKTSLVHDFIYNPWKCTPSAVFAISGNSSAEHFNCYNRLYSTDNFSDIFNSTIDRIKYKYITKNIENNGFIEEDYNISGITDDSQSLNQHPIYNRNSSNNQWNANQLIKSKTYNSNQSLIKESNNEYEIKSSTKFNNYNIEPGIYPVTKERLRPEYNTGKYYNTQDGCFSLFCGVQGGNAVSHYYNYVFSSKLTKQTTKEYLSSGTVTTETNYNYDSPNHLQLTKQSTTNSKGETLTAEYQYPSDLISGYEQSPIMQEMVNRNMIATPVITKSKNGSTVLSEQRTLYKYFPTTNGNLILPEFVYAKKGATTTAVDRKITYNSYDNQGNLTQYTLENGLPVSIIWGYGGQYPIAKLEGVALSQINAATITTLNTKTTDADLLAAITTLRNTHKDAMVTGYLYKPLVGVTQIIQPNGVAEKYNYDASNRLQSIVNDKGETLKTFQYNYKP
ncbi:hypothetical protein [Empedobacter sp. R132-2]|uniref:hypothetical protein n=1 Tax=Empedobacter sp. R132-2 TaxID=2746740 RepID=UPI002576CF51|nr:hypothetical protein [Empedobacter sp. R132-2]MDM1139757.1 hypothetical protein [Empedobacter sp. R132-2]